MTRPDDPIPACCVGIKREARAPERFGVDPCDDVVDGEPTRTWDVIERVSGTCVGNYATRAEARAEAKRRNAEAAGALCSDPETTAQPTGEP